MEISEETWLSEREAELFTYRYEEGLKLSECAEKMNIDENTVKSMLSRIREKKKKSRNTLDLFEKVDNT